MLHRLTPVRPTARVGAPVALAVVVLDGVLTGWATPRGPATTLQSLAAIAVSLAYRKDSEPSRHKEKVVAIFKVSSSSNAFWAAVNDGVIGNSLATFLHDRHPRTAHPPHPKAIA